MATEWYFLRVQVGREDRIRRSMVTRLKQSGLEELVPQIVVPTETVATHRAGKKRVQKRKLYPGYLMVQMDLTDDIWFVLRETPGFGDFVGSRSQPTPMSAEEVENVLSRMNASKAEPKMAVQFSKGDRVKIKQGPFENVDGVVEDVNAEKGTLEVSVTIFGRATPVSLGCWEVEEV
ncbi:MAG: transcription termination/antitermination protein NusG [Planctomycetota bacterium]|jgi:transcriptional antiterminator NusG|nr:transcription termination/antitermination protein NusG [Planctomycetota bacterium]